MCVYIYIYLLTSCYGRGTDSWSLFNQSVPNLNSEVVLD